MSEEPNPFEVQRRMDKATKIADIAEGLSMSSKHLATEWTNRYEWAEAYGMKPASKETWDMAVNLLSERERYTGEGGLDDPRVVQQLASMAVRMTETLNKHNVDSTDMTNMSRVEKRRAARLANVKDDNLVFDLASKFMEYRENHRMKGVK